MGSLDFWQTATVVEGILIFGLFLGVFSIGFSLDEARRQLDEIKWKIK